MGRRAILNGHFLRDSTRAFKPIVERHFRHSDSLRVGFVYGLAFQGLGYRY